MEASGGFSLWGLRVRPTYAMGRRLLCSLLTRRSSLRQQRALPGSNVPNQRFIVLAFVICSIMVGLVLRSASVAVMLGLGRADTLLGGAVPLSALIALAGGVVCFFILLKNTVAVRFSDEAIGELAKVTWPSREETINSSLVVVATSVIFSGSLALFDFVWARATNFFLFTAG